MGLSGKRTGPGARRPGGVRARREACPEDRPPLEPEEAKARRARSSPSPPRGQRSKTAGKEAAARRSPSGRRGRTRAERETTLRVKGRNRPAEERGRSRGRLSAGRRKGGTDASGGRSRRILRVFLVLLLFLSLGTLVWVYAFTSALNVRTVVVSGNERLEADYLRAISGITPETHLLRMDAGAVRRALLAEPYVKEVRVRRRFPATVVLEIQEREPLLFFRQNGRYHLVDDEGVVLESRDSPVGGFLEGEGIDLPLLYPGVRVETAVFSEMVALIRELPDALRREALRVGWREDEGFYLTVAATRIIFGASSEAARKGEIAYLALQETLSRYGELEYVDVTYPDHPVIKPSL